MSAPSLLSPGDVIAEDYRVVRLLGMGGMGAVYVAEQASTGVLRAVKTMHRHFVDDAALRRRFEQEARVSARIESEFVVHVLGAGVDAKLGLPWIAMELLVGEPLSVYLARTGALDVEAALEVLRPLSEALGAAHRVGVVHRDLKPENIFLARPRRSGDRFTLKVLDFGIAKLVADARTHTTGTLGTPQWMAPEQTVADAPVTASADVWALGLIAFTLLTGKRYWRASNAAETALPALMREIVLDPLDSASARAAALGVDVTLPEGFDAWFARCVNREASERFTDADDAFAALERALGLSSAEEPREPQPALPETAKSYDMVEATQNLPDAGPEIGSAPDVSATQAVRDFYAKHLPRETPSSDTPKKEAAAPTAEPGPVAQRPVASRPRRWVPVVGVLVVTAVVWVALSRFTRGGGETPGATAPSISESVRVAAPSAPPPSPSGASDVAKAEGDARPMVTFTGAAFVIGSHTGEANERPPTEVTVEAFLLDRDLVTAASYARCVEAGVCSKRAEGPHCNAASARAAHPANCVTAEQAEAYCHWLGRRLPSEIEWEWAAAGKAGRAHPWGAAPPDAARVCWNRCTESLGTCEIGQHPKGNTPEGVRDLAGNVWEWTSSSACPYSSPTCGDPRRITRGGDWCSPEAKLVRTRTREPRAPGDGTSTVGVRCARTM